MEFDIYQLVLLRRPDSAPPLDLEVREELQRQHIAHLERMHAAGSLLVAGPFGDQEDEMLRGLCLYRVESVDQARELAEQDPSVRAGRLALDVMSFYCPKGSLAFPLLDQAGPTAREP